MLTELGIVVYIRVKHNTLSCAAVDRFVVKCSFS